MSKAVRKVLFDANPLMRNRTGVGYYEAGIIDALAKRYPETSFVGYYYNFLGRKRKPATPTAQNIVYRPNYIFPGPIVNLLRRYHILLPVEFLALTKADFIFYPNFLGLSSLFGTPSANVIHDLTYIDLPDYVAQKNLHDLRRFVPENIRRAEFIATVSEFGKRRIHDELGVPEENILVTPIPPTPPTILAKAEQAKILASLGITGKYFLTLSTVEPRKNVLGMLAAYELLPDELQQKYTFVITGAIGWNCEAEVAKLDALKRAGKNILHLGYVTDEQKAALYQGAAFYTSASHYEGLGITPLEAMSYGTACALSDIGVFHEAAGNTALFFDKDSPRAIAGAWQELLRNSGLRKRLSIAGKRQADSYKWEGVAASLYNRIMQVLEQRT